MNVVTRLISACWDACKRSSRNAQWYESILPQWDYLDESIPKVIHQTTYSKDLKPELAENVEHLKRLNPDWAYMLYDDEDIKRYILEHYGQAIWSYYKRISAQYGAAKADFFRYLLIYREGGVYLDIKSSTTRPLDEVLKPSDRLIVAHWDNRPGELHEGQIFSRELAHLPRGEYVQWYIIASAGHPAIRAVILEMLRRMDAYSPFVTGVGFWGTIRTTGPVPYTLGIEQAIALDKGHYRMVETYQDLGIIYSIYEKEGRSLAHKEVLRTNYHKGFAPVVSHPNIMVQTVTTYYLSLMRKWRNQRES